MTEREQEIPYEAAAQQADIVEAMHPGISVSRDVMGGLRVGVNSTGTYDSGRHIHADIQRSTRDQKIPDLRLTVYDESEEPTTQLIARYDGQGYKTVDHVDGAEVVDTAEVVEQTRKGLELFVAYSQLPLRAKGCVAASKVYDESRSTEHMRQILAESSAKAVVAFLRDDDLYSLGPGLTFAVIKHAIEDLTPTP